MATEGATRTGGTVVIVSAEQIVGQVSNMREIVQRTMSAAKVVTI
jgi:hypothetical protein